MLLWRTEFGETRTELYTLSALGEVAVKLLSRVRLFATPWTVAHQALPSMGFSRQEYWSVLQFPSPGDLPDPGIEPGSPTLQADALTSEPGSCLDTILSNEKGNSVTLMV